MASPFDNLYVEFAIPEERLLLISQEAAEMARRKKDWEAEEDRRKQYDQAQLILCEEYETKKTCFEDQLHARKLEKELLEEQAAKDKKMQEIIAPVIKKVQLDIEEAMAAGANCLETEWYESEFNPNDVSLSELAVEMRKVMRSYGFADCGVDRWGYSFRFTNIAWDQRTIIDYRCSASTIFFIINNFTFEFLVRRK